MSLERNIERIADALEKLANPMMVAQNPVATTSAPVPPAIGVPAFTGVLPPDAFEMPKDGQELKTLAQNAASKLGEKIPAFTEWVRGTLCAKYGVKKVSEIPVEHIPAAAREMMGVVKSYGGA